MKRIIFILIALFSCTLASGQVMPGQVLPDSKMTISASDYEYYVLLGKQKDLLQKRKYAIVTTLAGSALISVGSVMTDDTGHLTESGAATVVIGELASLVGGIWWIVNEFKVINIQQEIDRKLMLELNPNGLILRF